MNSKISTTMEKLTIQQALAQGYTHYASNHPNTGFQRLSSIEDLTEQDLLEGKKYLADKESFSPAGIDNSQIKEILADHVMINHYCSIKDDDNTIYDAILAIDFQDVCDRIERVLANHKTFRNITEIELILESEVNNG